MKDVLVKMGEYLMKWCCCILKFMGNYNLYIYVNFQSIILPSILQWNEPKLQLLILFNVSFFGL